ncbi:Polynucleotide 5'-hydroxyl-kinase [Lachnellula occidentalis]|uniref:Polynucleotide 5'-hydroxyl-kinase GRC3 n=1 Tax=Lachnellula occidentalis TaxID=215460 RepID=A0A8H8S794_9HELO|nr:Polynucleotide 5'-hydroxyl-kinase [Lachnellula occidentalis]
MSSYKKKRRLDKETPGQTPQLSAVAARRALQSKAQAPPTQNNDSESNVFDETASSAFSVLRKSAPVPQEVLIDETTQKDRNDETGSRRTIIEVEEEDGQNALSSTGSRAESPEAVLERPSIPLSSFKPNKNNVKELKNNTVLLSLAPGERLVLVGQCDITVRRGQITLLGATLQASKNLHRVYAPSSHALPVLRCMATEIDAAEVCLHQCESGLGHLKSLSPLFGKLWNDGSGPLGPDFESILRLKHGSTYQIVRSTLSLNEHMLNFDQLFSSQDGPPKAFLYPIISPPEWNAALSKLSEPGTPVSAIFVCGPKSSGKSTFGRLLTNRLLSNTNGIALLDLDPGQPEYSTPGHLSLVHLQEPNFGPPYTHPIPHGKSRTIHSHTIGAVTPSMDPAFYMSCASDLLAHYRNLLSIWPNCPLVINTPGWVLGTGLEILVDLITKIRPTDIIYMSQAGPPEVTASLKEAAKGKPLFTLPSQASEYTTRTAAHLRTMQSMSYFHLDPSSNGKRFNTKPLTSIPPWEIRYSRENPGILGIICYGEQPPAEFLADTINGSLVSIVAIDDDAAIPGWHTQDEKKSQTIHQDLISLTTDPNLHPFDTTAQPLQTPLLIRTPTEDLPYFNPLNSITLDPTHSHTIGLALVRGIDIPRRRLQILTPVPSTLIEEINESGKKIVLVSGKLDTPGWAYTESLVLEKDMKKRGEDMGMGGVMAQTPWVERLEGSQGRGVGARVWRVRRDLGKMGDGD